MTRTNYEDDGEEMKLLIKYAVWPLRCWNELHVMYW